MYDVACEFARAAVGSKDAQKQLTRTSISIGSLQFLRFPCVHELSVSAYDRVDVSEKVGGEGAEGGKISFPSPSPGSPLLASSPLPWTPFPLLRVWIQDGVGPIKMRAHARQIRLVCRL